MSDRGFIRLTLHDGRPLVLNLDAIESVSARPVEHCWGAFKLAPTYVHTRSGDGHCVRDGFDLLAAMLLDRGRELSPAEEAQVMARAVGLVLEAKL